MKRAWNYIASMWQPAGALIVASFIIAVLFSYHLGSLVPGTATTEVNTRNSSLNIKTILDNPVNAPYKAAQLVARSINTSISAERLVNGIAAGLTIILFYLIVRRFASPYAAGASTLLYATSSSLLLNGRLASPQIMLLLLFVLFVCGYRLRFNKHRSRSWLYSAAILGLALYTPGLIYFIVAGVIWQYRAVKRDHEWPDPLLFGTWCLILVVLLLPLILGFIHNPEIWHEYFGVPTAWPSIASLVKNILAVPAGILVFAPKNPVFRLGRQPLLDAFTAIMFIIGCWGLLKKYRLDRLVLFAGIFVLGILFTALTGNYETSFVLVPFVYLIVGMGITLLLEEWNKIFPNNPLARWLAVIVVSLAVIVSANFQLRRYYVAWPHNAMTKSVFRIR